MRDHAFVVATGTYSGEGVGSLGGICEPLHALCILAGEGKQLVTQYVPSPRQQWVLAATKTTMHENRLFQTGSRR